MTATRAEANAMRADRAERLLETLRLREPAEADLQASAMVMAGLKLLQEVRGTPSVLDTLTRLRSAVTADEPDAPEAAAPVPEHLADTLYRIAAAEPPAEGLARAEAMMVAATALLVERLGTDHALTALGMVADHVQRGRPHVAAPRPTAAELACAMADHLRGLPRDDAHERARGVVAGAAAYLHEALGRTHAGAVLGGTLDAAERYGVEVRGGRDSHDTLH